MTRFQFPTRRLFYRFCLPLVSGVSPARVPRALFSLGLLLYLGQTTMVQAEMAQAQLYTPPPDRGTPPSSKTTGSRGDCFYHRDRPPLAALVGQKHLSQTMSDRPTIWFYSPYSASETHQAELVLVADATDTELYRGRFELRHKPGIQGIQWASTVAPLQVGQLYRWYIDLHCQSNQQSAANSLSIPTNGSRSSSPATLTGIIERVEEPATVRQGLKAVSAVDAIAFYGQHHLWYDLVTALAHQRLENPGDRQLQQMWQNLLQDEVNVGLGFLSTEPLLNEATTVAQ